MFWKPKQKLKYKVMDNPKSALQRVELGSGPFKHVLYEYGMVRMVEDSGMLKLSFSFTVISGTKKHNIESLNTSPSFKEHIGKVLQDLIEKDYGN